MKISGLILLLSSVFAFAGGLKPGNYYNFVVEGDSQSAFWGGASGWPRFFTNHSTIPPFIGRFSNAAVSGEYATNFANQYADQVYPYRPAGTTNAWCFVFGGINDIGSGGGSGPIVPVDTIYAALSNYWRTARQDGFKVYAFTITHRTQYSDALLNQAWTNLNNLIVGSSNCWDVVFRTDLRFPDASDTNDYRDGVHLTDAAFQELGDEVALSLRHYNIKSNLNISGTLVVGP